MLPTTEPRTSRVINATPFFYGWVVLAAGTLGLLLMGPSQGFTVSLFLDLWVTDLNLSRSTVSLLYGGASLSAAFLLPGAGRLVDRFGPRRVVVVISLGLGLAAGFLVAPGEAAVIIGIALSSTALGTLLPILRDAGEMNTPFGRAVTALGAVGEFGPLVAISLFLSGRNIDIAALVLILFIVISALAIHFAMRVPQGRLHTIVRATLHTSSQFAIRVIIVILALLVVLSIVLDLDMLLGAFAAGVVWQVLMRNAPERDREQVESKIEGLAFGFLVPIFFIYTGVTFDLEALLADPLLLAFVPIFLVLLLVVRGIPSTFIAPEGSTTRDRVSLGLLGATGLPIIVAVTQIGVSEQIIPSGIAAALVGAGVLSVLLYPLIGMALRGERPTLPSDGILREEA